MWVEDTVKESECQSTLVEGGEEYKPIELDQQESGDRPRQCRLPPTSYLPFDRRERRLLKIRKKKDRENQIDFVEYVEQ